jgi:DNA-binding MarR family transcriptional regulator
MKITRSEEIKKALEEAIASGEINDITVDRVMQTLDNKKVLRYHRDHEISLLSTAGRVLVAIIEDPTMTIRAISVYLDLSETMIDKTVKQLIAGGLITKTKVNRQNVYRLNNKSVLEQPDIHHLISAINMIVGFSSSSDEDSSKMNDDKSLVHDVGEEELF